MELISKDLVNMASIVTLVVLNTGEAFTLEQPQGSANVGATREEAKSHANFPEFYRVTRNVFGHRFQIGMDRRNHLADIPHIRGTHPLIRLRIHNLPPKTGQVFGKELTYHPVRNNLGITRICFIFHLTARC